MPKPTVAGEDVDAPGDDQSLKGGVRWGGVASARGARRTGYERRHLGRPVLLCFQAEDGIRDYKVTGVQTCALPISRPHCRSKFCRGPTLRWVRKWPSASRPRSLAI